MHDPKMEPREFVGQSREDALAKATSFFGAAEQELVITELDPAQVHGAASRAVIVAVPRGARPAERPRARERDRGRPRGRQAPSESRPRATGIREEPAPPAREEVEPAEPSKGTATTELSEVGAFVLGIVERMGIGPFEIAENVEGTHRILQLRGPATVGLAGGGGRTVDAVQLLANQAAMRRDDELRVVLDVEGDPDRREGLLTRVAERAARRAKSSGRAVALDPMGPKDRRAVHVALRDSPQIATMSMGEGRYRQVVVVPEGAPEYEEARRQAEAVSQERGE